ncbi:MAG: hypothetical protein JWP13_751 [Candidatus Saccharibacteria bacterium]|nr:hypothetical protein [Candidatus Saccharibacteria bacterium]
MSESSPSVSFTSLEVPAPIEGGQNYLDYWARHDAADPDLLGAKALHRATLVGAAFVREPDDTFPYKAVLAWDSSLGSFNHMQYGEGDLLRGAAILLRTNHEGGPSEFPVVRIPDPKNVPEAFLDVAEQLGDMTDQKPSRALKLGSQLVHKAALVERDSARQTALLEVAGAMYGRNYRADTPWDKEKIHTGQLLADINFHRLSQNIRSACRARQGVKAYRREAAGLLRGQAEDLLRYEDLLDKGGQPRNLSGNAFELLTTITVRHLVYLSSDLKGDHSQIRTAFDSEEHPMHPGGTLRKRSFDLVHTRVTRDDHVVGSRLWQMKMGSEGERNYHPAIDVVAARNVSMRTIFDIARSLRQVYASGRYQSPVAQLPLVSEVVKPFMLPKSRAA